MENSVDYTRSRPSAIPALARAAVWGGLTLIDPNKQTGWRKHAYWLAMAGVTVWEVGASQDQEIDVATKAGVGVGLAGVTYGAQDLLAKTDAWSMRLVEKVDRRRPRVWMALLAAGTSLASSVLDNKFAGDDFADEPPLMDDATELSDEVRGLVTTILDGHDGYGSDELREQLKNAQMIEFDGAGYFTVDADAPRTLASDYIFPARAEFERDGRTHIVELVVEDGQLAGLHQYTEPTWEEGDAEPNWDLPHSDDLRVTVGQ